MVVMSYETLRSDVDWAGGLSWLYCVLDEGHMIRNPKSKLAQVCPAPFAMASPLAWLTAAGQRTVLWSLAMRQVSQHVSFLVCPAGWAGTRQVRDARE